MMRLSRLLVTVVVSLVMTTGVSWAQTPPSAQPKTPFPADAKIAFVNLQYVFATSRDGKAAATELKALQTKKNADIAAKTKEVQTLELKLSETAAVIGDEARERLQRDVARAKVDFERLVQDSEAEVQDRQEQFRRAFSRKLFPAIGEVAKERDLWAVFSVGQDTLLWHQPAMDISDEVIGRIDGGR